MQDRIEQDKVRSVGNFVETNCMCHCVVINLSSAYINADIYWSRWTNLREWDILKIYIKGMNKF